MSNTLIVLNRARFHPEFARRRFVSVGRTILTPVRHPEQPIEVAESDVLLTREFVVVPQTVCGRLSFMQSRSGEALYIITAGTADERHLVERIQREL